MNRYLRQPDASFLGDEGAAAFLVDSLNDLANTAVEKQTSQIILDLRDLRRFVRQKRYVDPHGRPVGSRAVALFRKINSQLREVKWSPFLSWSAKKSSTVDKGLTFRWGSLNSSLGDDSRFLMGIVFNLAATGLLWKVRKCGWEKCLKWLCARSRNSRFCTERCRIAHHRRRSPKGRATNRKSQMEYRKRILKEGRRADSRRRK